MAYSPSSQDNKHVNYRTCPSQKETCDKENGIFQESSKLLISDDCMGQVGLPGDRECLGNRQDAPEASPTSEVCRCTNNYLDLSNKNDWFCDSRLPNPFLQKRKARLFPCKVSPESDEKHFQSSHSTKSASTSLNCQLPCRDSSLVKAIESKPWTMLLLVYYFIFLCLSRHGVIAYNISTLDIPPSLAQHNNQHHLNSIPVFSTVPHYKYIDYEDPCKSGKFNVFLFLERKKYVA